MTKTTPRHGLPYPEAGDPIYQGAAQMQALAEAVDEKIGTGGGGGGSVPDGLLERFDLMEADLDTATPSATPSTLVRRSAAGNISVAGPTVDGHAATKRYVDQAVAASGGGDGDWQNDPTEVIDLTADVLAPWTITEDGTLSLVRSGGWMILRVMGLSRPEGTWGNVTGVVIPDEYRPDVSVAGNMLAGGNGDPAEIRAMDTGRVYAASVVAGQTYNGFVMWPIPTGSPVPVVEGPSGADGAEGPSAYQVAVANGFSGTPAQWLASLRGPAGADGADGERGERGPTGPEPDMSSWRTELYGGPSRTRRALAEIAVTRDFSVPGTTDRLAQASWTPLVDTDGGAIISGTYSQTRYVIPVAGRWRITYQLMHNTRSKAGAAIKVLCNGTDVHQHSIASKIGAGSYEGPTISLNATQVLRAGDVIRWGYWYSSATTILAQGMGNVRSKIVLEWTGPR